MTEGDLGPAAAAPPRSIAVVRSILHNPAALWPIGFLTLVALVCIAAPLVAPYDPRVQDLGRVLTGPTRHNLLGTDTLGRDVLSRLLHGGSRSLLSVLEAVSVVLAVGTPLGLVAGYAGGWMDRVLGRLAEAIMAIPGIILVLVVLAILPRNEDAAMVTFGLLGVPGVLRVIRGATLRVREDLYVAAARVSGLTHAQIAVRHILPRVWGPVVVQASLFAAYALLFETGVAYLGLTADPSTPTWGGMVSEASTVIQQQPWLLVPSGTLIALTILAFGLLGDAVRDSVVVGEGGSAGVAARPVVALGPVEAGRQQVQYPNGQSGPLLQVLDLSVAQAGSRAGLLVVDRVSFDVFPGEVVGIIGESGSGKSVTALTLLRLLPPGLYPAGGQVLWEGRDLLRTSDQSFQELRGSGLAYVSQEPQASLDPAFTVGSQLVEMIRYHHRVSRSAARASALELLRQVELPDPEQVARAHAHQLSGGMAQRVAIAFALAGRPRLLIADEPTTALDVTVQAEILALLRRLRRESGMAMILITHDWGVVADSCDTVVVMYAGQAVEQSGVQQLFELPAHPYASGLLRAHPSLAPPGARRSSMPGTVPSPGSWPAGCRFAPRCRLVIERCLEAPVPLTPVGQGRLSRCVRAQQLLDRAIG